MMDAKQIKNIVEACLLVAGKAMSLRQLDDLFEGDENRPDKDTLKTCIEELQSEYEGRGIELVRVASGYRLQSRTEVSDWVARLFPEKPPRYSRALLETLVLVAYRQPITRGEIEEIRGVAVSSNIVKTLQERQWVKEVGFKDVPGKPALLGTTKSFLDYFNLKRLDDLPPLSEIKNLDEMDSALMEAAGIAPVPGPVAANDGDTDLEGQPIQSADVSDVDEKTVYAAGEAVNSEANIAGNQADNNEANSEHDELPVVEEAVDDSPVTFAGLVSRLPNQDESTAENTANASAKVTEVNDLDENSDTEITESETATEQPDAEQTLLSTVSEFANEHQKEIDARDELESQLKTNYMGSASGGDANPEASESEPEEVSAADDTQPVTAEADDDQQSKEAASDTLSDEIDASSTSPDVLSDTFVGDTPGAGETLH